MVEITGKLKLILVERGIKQREFAKQVGISETSLSLICRNKTLPSLELAYNISRALNLNVEDIWKVKNSLKLDD